MRDIVVVLGAGGPAGYNVAAAAKDAGYRVIGYDSEESHLPFAAKVCDRVTTELEVPFPGTTPVLPQPESLVVNCAIWRDNGLMNYHGPRRSTIEITQDKLETNQRWAYRGLKPHWPVPIMEEIPDYLHIAKDRFGLPFWLRASKGAGARGAILVEDLRAAFHWIRLYQVSIHDTEFIAEEYLPGRDFCWTALYHEGERVASFSRERLEWLYPHLAPFSGRTGTPTRSRVVHDPVVTMIGARAVEILDPSPHGVYCVDMREGADGVPQPTEINAGRWATTSPMYRAFGANLVALQIRLAHGDGYAVPGDDCYPDGAELFRHIDMGMVAEPHARGWGI